MRNNIIKYKFVLYMVVVYSTFLTGACYENPEPRTEPLSAVFSYPDTGYFGENLLRENPPAIVLNKVYSLHVQIENEGSVRIVLPASFTWDYLIDPPPIGWTGEGFIIRNGKGVFTAATPGAYDIQIIITGPSVNGAGDIKIYENDAVEPIRVNSLTW